MALSPIRRRDLFTILASAVGGATLLAACGGTAATTSGSVSASAAAQTAASSSAAAMAAASSNATPNPLQNVPVKSGKTALDWWFGWGGMTALNTFATLATTFNKEHDDYQIKPLQVSDISTGRQPTASNTTTRRRVSTT